MRIPKTIKIGGRTYEVFLRDRFNQDGDSAAGSHYGWTQKIWIDKTQHLEAQESALLHEIIEAINQEADLELSHQQISILETMFYQVLKDNNLIK